MMKRSFAFLLGILVITAVVAGCLEEEDKDIVETAQDDGDLETLVEALEAADLVDALKEDGPFTVFAPEDAAFEALDQEYLTELLENDTETLADILTFHVLPAEVMSEDLTDGQTVETLNGKYLTVNIDGDTVTVNGAEVIEADIECSNGVIHIIDTVLVPGLNIVETAQASEDLETLVTAVISAGLDATLSNEAETYTVFAPDDDAFAALDQDYLTDLLENDTETLAEILGYHVVEGMVMSTDLSDGQVVETIQGQNLTISISGSTVSIDGAEVVTPDIVCTNGVVHIIDAVLLPEMNIVQKAIDTPELSTLVDAVTAAGLVETLSDEGAEFTVFAPSNDAFGELDPLLLADLLNNDTETLTEILTYHVVAGEYLSTDLADGMTLETVNGKYLEVAIDGGVQVDGAAVVTADVQCSNGVVHIIDAVMLPQDNIVETAIADGNFTSLVDAVVAAGLDDTLSDESTQFTVFAPTDDAFAALDPALLNDLLTNDTENLTAILTYHVIAGEYLSTDLADGMTLETVNGADLTINITDGIVTVDGATVTAVDIECSNGVIHVIDAVMIPPEPTLANIQDTLTDLGDFTFSLNVTEELGIDDRFTNESLTTTAFLITDDTFATYDQAFLDNMIDNETENLTYMINYSMVDGLYLSADLSDGMTLETLAGENITVSIDNETVMVDGATVVEADILCTNGVVHVIDSLLTPPSMVPPLPNIVETAIADGNFTSLAAALTAADLVDTLSDENATFTVFAPTDDAFAALDPALLNDLLTNDTATLTSILLYHVVMGEVMSTDLMDGMEVETVNGANCTVTIDNGTVFINDAEVIIADIECSNGIIHVIDTVLIPPEPEEQLNIVETAIADGNFTSLVEAVTAADLVDTLSDENATFTVFAPTDDAFAALDQTYLTDLLNNDTANLTAILTYHVLPAIYEAADLSDGMNLTTVEGSDINVTIHDSTVTLDGVATVILTDIQCSNGVIHVIDAVLIPPTIG